MAVALDALMTAGNSGDGLSQEIATDVAINSTGITVGASAKLLVAVLATGHGNGAAPTSVSMTWNGTAMTAGPTVTSGTGNPFAWVAIFYLINPAAGANTLHAQWTNSNDMYMSAVSFTGTDTSTGINAAHNATATNTTTLTITSDTAGATVAVFAVDGAAPTVNFTKIFSEAPFNPGGGASYTLGGTSNGHTFTGGGGTVQALAGVHVIAAAGGTPVLSPHYYNMMQHWFAAA